VSAAGATRYVATYFQIDLLGLTETLNLKKYTFLNGIEFFLASLDFLSCLTSKPDDENCTKWRKTSLPV
jgi:hypothetical protein